MLPLRTEPLVPEEHIVGLAYPHGDLRTADGRFVGYGADDNKLAGTPFLKCTTETIGLCSITAPQERQCSIVKVGWWRSSPI